MIADPLQDLRSVWRTNPSSKAAMPQPADRPNMPESLVRLRGGGRRLRASSVRRGGNARLGLRVGFPGGFLCSFDADPPCAGARRSGPARRAHAPALPGRATAVGQSSFWRPSSRSSSAGLPLMGVRAPVQRPGGTNMPAQLQWIGAVGVLAAMWIFHVSTAANPFLAAVVRIQTGSGRGPRSRIDR